MLDKNKCIRIELNSKRTKTYIFKCEMCPKELRVRESYMETHSKKCISCVKKKRPYESIYNTFIYNCKETGRKCDISYKDFLNYTKIKNCHYCENKLKWTEYLVKKEFSNECYYLDRMDNNKDYIKSNITVCCSFCNYLKGNRFNYEEFMLLSPVLKTIRLNRIKNVD